MSLRLDSLQQRILGVLIEKEMTVPDAYPLTVNALVTGCNQKNNRDPVLQVEDFDVEGALRALMDDGWVTRRERDGGRTMRYAHEAAQQLGVEAADLALLAELMLRGPQAPGALKTRASRMAPLGSAEAIEARLAAMAARPVPYVVLLPRRPREQQARWGHLLDGRAPEDALAAWAAGESAPAAAPAPPPPRAAAPGPTPPARAAEGPQVADLEARVADLEREVADLGERLGRLEGR
jgi:uncharacterized protein YceH (UPF0502 family)